MGYNTKFSGVFMIKGDKRVSNCNFQIKISGFV